MRWSLILSIFAVLLGIFTFSAYGLVIPSEIDDDLVARGRNRGKAAIKKKASHRAKDCKTSASHGHTYDVQKDKASMKKWQADHIVEKQMVHAHLAANKLSWGKIPKATQDKVDAIINGPGNLTPIPGGVNSSKGSRVRNTMKKNDWTPRQDRDHYMKQAHPQAKRIAHQVDRAYRQGGIKMKTVSVVNFVNEVWNAKGTKNLTAKKRGSK